MSEVKGPDWVKEAIHLYSIEKLGLKQVAERVSRACETVREQLIRNGVQLRSRQEGARLGLWGKTEEGPWIEEAIYLYCAEGLSLAQVAERVGRACNTVRYHLIRRGVQLRTNQEGIRLRVWSDNGTLGLRFEPNEVTISLVGFGLGDGSLQQRGLQYSIKPQLLKDYLVSVLQKIGLRPSTYHRPNGVWEVWACDVR